VLDIVAPIFGLVLLGYGAAKAGTFDEAATRGLSLFVFNFAIPIMLVRTLGRVALPPEPDWALLVAYFAGAFAVYAAGTARRGRVLGAAAPSPRSSASAPRSRTR
jgi:predicted permease